MVNWLDKLLDVTILGNSKVAFTAGLENLAKQTGFDWYAYLNLRPGNPYAVSNLPSEYQRIYFESSFHRVDPIIKRAGNERKAFVWNRDDVSLSCSSTGCLPLRKLADRFEVRSGIAIPIRGPFGQISLFTLVSREPVVPVQSDIDPVAAAGAAAQIHARLEHLECDPSAQGRMTLSPREAVFLRWAAEGKAMEDTAVIEDVKYNTVRISLERARQRYNAANITQLTAMAIRNKLI